jgi:hypothetical protein
LNANYPQHYYKVNPDLEMTMEGDYPHCRYFSLIAYDYQNQPIATLLDQKIIPDKGSSNPFLPGANWNAPQRHYTIKVRFEQGNAKQEGFYGSQNVRGNIMYLGRMADGSPNSGGRIAYRRYLPSKGFNSDCGVPNPKITYRRIDTGEIVEPPHIGSITSAVDFSAIRHGAKNGDGSMREQLKQWRRDGETKTNGLQWKRSAQSSALGENPETVYIGAPIHADRDTYLSISWKAPITPRTYDNLGIRGDEQLRYWSLSFAGRNTRTLLSLADNQVVIDRHGNVKVMVRARCWLSVKDR